MKKSDKVELSRELFAEQYERLKALDDEIKAQDQRISRLRNANELHINPKK